MGCPGCPENDTNLEETLSPNIIVLKCPNGDKILHIEIKHDSPCSRLYFCNKIEKGNKDFCSENNCTEWLDDLVIKITCPICKKNITYYYANCSIRIHPFNIDGNVIAIKNIKMIGNTIDLDVIVPEVK